MSTYFSSFYSFQVTLCTADLSLLHRKLLLDPPGLLRGGCAKIYLPSPTEMDICVGASLLL